MGRIGAWGPVPSHHNLKPLKIEPKHLWEEDEAVGDGLWGGTQRGDTGIPIYGGPDAASFPGWSNQIVVCDLTGMRNRL